MPLVFIKQVGQNLAFIAPLEGPVDPGFGVGGGYPDNTLPGGGLHPWLPGHVGGGNRPDNSLPGGPNHPDNRPPNNPPPVAPGQTLVLVRDPVGVWHYATIDASTPPPRPVPVPPSPGHPSGQPIIPPGATAPPTPGTPLPPTAAPKPA